MKKVLITGMSGLIGGLLRRHLEDDGGYELTALNRSPLDGVRCVQADIADLDAIKPAFVGQDTVVHLAAHLKDEPFETLQSVNLTGAYNVYEAARSAGVRRVVFASSGSTIKGWEDILPYRAMAEGRYENVPEIWPMITHEMVRPRGAYGASKVWGEAVGRHFSDTYEMSVLCVRIGSVLDHNDPSRIGPSMAWLSHRDVVDILVRSIDAPQDLRYDIFLATSRNRYGYRDLEHARDVLGYVPQDTDDSAFQT
jgi:nucleoside-diphosphate-sugar epimerase